MSILSRSYVRVVKRHADCCEGDDDGYIYQVQVCDVVFYKPFTRVWRDRYQGDAFRGARRELQHAESIARTFATAHKAEYLGVHDSTVRASLNPVQKLLKKIRKFFTGPQGEQGIPGAPGYQGPMGMRGPAYDDLQCPHCKYYRSQTGVGLFMEAEVGGVFSYQCRNKKCNEKSFWKPINGLWVWQGPMVNPDDALR